MEWALFDTVLDGVFIVNSENQFVYCNDAFALLAGYPARRMIGKSPRDLLPDNQVLFEQIEAVLGGAEHMPYAEITFVDRAKESKPVQISSQSMQGHALCFVRDVSLETVLHDKYKRELSQKEGFIAQLDRKVFELQFLLDTVNLVIDQGDNEFLKYLLMKRILDQLKMDYILTFKCRKQDFGRNEVMPQEFSYSDGTSTVKIRGQIARSSERWATTDLDAVFANGACILTEGDDFYAVSASVVSKNQDRMIFSYHYPKKDLERARQDQKLLESVTKQTFLLVENQELFRQSITDEKTKLYNQRYFKFRLEQEIKRSRNIGLSFALLVFDIDHFKKFNDTHGHLVGDQVLIETAKVIRGCFRATDIVSRFGGEEFVVIAVETNVEGARLAAERSRKAVEAMTVKTAEGKELKVTVSIGVALCPEHAIGADEIFEVADQALYKAKQGGRNRVEFAK